MLQVRLLFEIPTVHAEPNDTPARTRQPVWQPVTASPLDLAFDYRLIAQIALASACANFLCVLSDFDSGFDAGCDRFECHMDLSMDLVVDIVDVDFVD